MFTVKCMVKRTRSKQIKIKIRIIISYFLIHKNFI